METKTYFAQLPSTGEFIGIKHGETGYYRTTVYDQEHANHLNEGQGISPQQVQAALECSMVGNWEKFDSLVDWENRHTQKTEAA